MPNVLGIDICGKHVGLAVVEQPDNRVLWCGTVHLADKIKDLYHQRRWALLGCAACPRPRPVRSGLGTRGEGERARFFLAH